MENNENESLIRALRRKAFGYTVSEQATEYDAEGNEVKNKVTTKEVPPDLTAIKMLLEMGGEETASEEELERERDRLLSLLAEMQKARESASGGLPPAKKSTKKKKEIGNGTD